MEMKVRKWRKLTESESNKFVAILSIFYIMIWAIFIKEIILMFIIWMIIGLGVIKMKRPYYDYYEAKKLLSHNYHQTKPSKSITKKKS